MSDEFRITESQRAFLASLKCERLREHPELNDKLLKSFTVKHEKWRGPLDHLKEDGLNDDLSGKAAVYIVKTADGQGLLAFSLKCSELFDHRVFTTKLSDWFSWKFYKFLLWISSHTGNGHLKAICDRIGKHERTLLLKKIEKDRRVENNDRIKRVKNTLPGILLIDFCKNYSAQPIWDNLNLGAGRSMGEILFWFSIYPVLSKVRDLVGCEYILLYAADTTLDKNLINFYKGLHFQKVTDFGVNKPMYDMFCPLMSQRISEMKAHRDELEATFNKSPVKPTAEESAKLDSSLG